MQVRSGGSAGAADLTDDSRHIDDLTDFDSDGPRLHVRVPGLHELTVDVVVDEDGIAAAARVVALPDG
nr:hypothetical protein [Agrococcus carbonis]